MRLSRANLGSLSRGVEKAHIKLHFSAHHPWYLKGRYTIPCRYKTSETANPLLYPGYLGRFCILLSINCRSPYSSKSVVEFHHSRPSELVYEACYMVKKLSSSSSNFIIESSFSMSSPTLPIPSAQAISFSRSLKPLSPRSGRSNISDWWPVAPSIPAPADKDCSAFPMSIGCPTALSSESDVVLWMPFFFGAPLFDCVGVGGARPGCGEDGRSSAGSSMFSVFAWYLFAWFTRSILDRNPRTEKSHSLHL